MFYVLLSISSLRQKCGSPYKQALHCCQPLWLNYLHMFSQYALPDLWFIIEFNNSKKTGRDLHFNRSALKSRCEDEKRGFVVSCTLVMLSRKRHQQQQSLVCNIFIGRIPSKRKLEKRLRMISVAFTLVQQRRSCEANYLAIYTGF